jgi:hypothetical protein
MQPGITLIDPQKTPILSMLNDDGEALGTSTPNWEQVSLSTPQDNTDAVAQGAAFLFVDEKNVTRKQNVARTFERTVEVSDISEAEQHYNIGSMREKQLEWRFSEYKRDHEWALINSTLNNATEASAQRYRGILESIVDNGNNTAAAVALTETLFKTAILKPIYDDGGDPTDVFAGYTQHAILDSFIGQTGTTPYIDVTNRTRIDYLNVYDSLLGRVNLHLLRDIYLADGVAADTVFALDRRFWSYRWLIPTIVEKVARTGHSWQSVIHGTACLIDLNGKTGASHTLLT